MKKMLALANRTVTWLRTSGTRLFTAGVSLRLAVSQFTMAAAMLCAVLLPGLGVVWFLPGYLPTRGDVAGQTLQGQTTTPPQRKVLSIQNLPPSQTVSPAGAVNNPGAKTIEEQAESDSPPEFYVALEKALARRGARLENVCAKNDPVARRILEDYGAMFVASERVMPPPQCIFESEEEVALFQETAKFTSAVVGGAKIELQPAAMEALLAARAEAHKQRLDITPRGGSEAARRSYNDTVRLWNTRFLPALTYWQGRGRLTKAQATRLRQLSLHDQVKEVLELEKSGIYFSQDFSKSILYSIAAPGTSQHMSMLALDVSQFGDARVRQILARHGWFQTVKSDLPHFTYLGVEEKDLPGLGLRQVRSGAQLFWIPNLESDREQSRPKEKK